MEEEGEGKRAPNHRDFQLLGTAGGRGGPSLATRAPRHTPLGAGARQGQRRGPWWCSRPAPSSGPPAPPATPHEQSGDSQGRRGGRNARPPERGLGPAGGSEGGGLRAPPPCSSGGRYSGNRDPRAEDHFPPCRALAGPPCVSAVETTICFLPRGRSHRPGRRTRLAVKGSVGRRLPFPASRRSKGFCLLGVNSCLFLRNIFSRTPLCIRTC